MRIVFMGTPEFAVPSLRALARNHDVVGVFCQPDRPKGRSRKPVACPVKEAALELGIEVFQPKRIRVRKWVTRLTELAPDVIAVAAFGQILSQKVLDIPRLGCLNVHASLLPRWRGASPIHYAIKEGDSQTGVAIMSMVLELDAGPVYASQTIDINQDTRRPQLEQDLAQMGADLLVKTLPHLGKREPVSQDPVGVTYAPIIKKDFGYVDFNRQSAADILNTVRAFEGWPAVYCRFRQNPLKLVDVRVLEGGHENAPGEVVVVTRKKLAIACARNTLLEILEVQPAGKKVQPVVSFINGYKPLPQERFEPMA